MPHTVAPQDLVTLGTGILEAVGVPASDARLLADSLVTADLWGHSSAPWGGRAKAVGTNPWSIAAPAGSYGPVVMDIANTAVARGKIYLAEERGTSIPEGWAADADGVPTTDPRGRWRG